MVGRLTQYTIAGAVLQRKPVVLPRVSWYNVCKIEKREESIMLKLVLGGSGSGKTTLLYARIKARAEAG